MISQEQDTNRLQDLLGRFYAGRISRPEVRAGVIGIVLDRIACDRVSLWKFDGDEGDLSLLCFASQTAGGVLDTTERRLGQPEYGDYFNALIERGTYVSSDAMNDRALQPMRASYLVPNGVRSLLDAAFLLNGRAYGMVCCEETGSLREWRAGEVHALRVIVNRLALLMSAAAESTLWSTPSRALHAIAASPSVIDARR